MNETMNLCQSFAFEAEGTKLISPCLMFEVFVYFAEGPEVLDFYQRVREALGNLLTHYDTGSGRSSKITARSETLMPTWCNNPTPWPKKQYCLLMGGAAADIGATAASMRIDFNCRASHPTIFPRTSLYCTIPLDHPLAQKDAFADWVTQLKVFKDGYFISGSCGLGLNFPYNFPSHELHIETINRVSSLLLRYPGLDVQSIMLGIGLTLMQRDQEFIDRHQKNKGRPYLKRVNWLTFLNEDQIDLLGGMPALKEQFLDVSEIKLRELAHGVCIQAGSSPELGSSADADYIPLYQKVAKAVRTVRLDTVKGGALPSEFRHNGVLDWLNAFD